MIIKNGKVINKLIHNNKKILKVYLKDKLVYLVKESDISSLYDEIEVQMFENFEDDGVVSTRFKLIDEPVNVKELKNITNTNNVYRNWTDQNNARLFAEDELKLTLKNNKTEIIFGKMTAINYFNVSKNDLTFNQEKFYISTEYSNEGKILKELKYNLFELAQKIKNCIDRVDLLNISLEHENKIVTDKVEALRILHSLQGSGYPSTQDKVSANYKIYFKNLDNLKIYGLENQIKDYSVSNLYYNYGGDSVSALDQVLLTFCVEINIDNKNYYLKVDFNYDNASDTHLNVDKDFYQDLKYIMEIRFVENPEEIHLNFENLPKFTL